MSIFRNLAAIVLLSGAAQADVPRVVADIAPVHSLVARVMDGIGTPELILPAGTSPHAFALRPSQARALQSASLLVWVGPELTPWLDKAATNLAGGARQLQLLDVEGTHLHAYRDTHDDHGEADDDPGEHDDHDDDDHDDDDDQGHHAHEGVDPHGWLDPENGIIWLDAIATALAEEDPENAVRYLENAAQGGQELVRLTSRIANLLAPVRDRPYVTFHDAYQYFETRFQLTFAGAVSVGDATDPGPGRLAALQSVVRDRGVVCGFSEPQFDDRLLRAVADGAGLQIAVLDPMGRAIQPGKALYAEVLWAMATSFATCGTE